jgi:hypothetical protein
MTSAAVIGLGGHALLLAAGTVLLARGRITSPRSRLGAALAVVILAAAPLGSLSGLAYLRGVFGELSVTTMALLVLALMRNFSIRAGMPEGERSLLLAAIGFVALVFYPPALGLGPFDPYAAGFGSPLMLGALLAAFVAAWFRGMFWIATSIVLGVAGWLGGILESSNLWDYLLDPLIAVYAWGSVVARFISSRRSSSSLAPPGA